MNVLIIGAGAVASVVSQQLAKDRKVDEVVCCSRNLKRAKEFLDLTSHKISLRRINAADKDEVVKAAKDIDLIINASLPNFNEVIMEAALIAGVNYQDLCSFLKDCRHAEQLKFHEKFKRRGIVGLMNTGLSPGITNLLARQMAGKLDRVDEIKIRLLENQRGSELIFAWSPEVTLDELVSPPLVFRNGGFRLVKPFEDIEEYTFPQFGKKHVFNIYGDEVSTIPLYIKTKNINVKSCGSDVEFAKALYKLGLFSKEPVRLANKKIIPLQFFAEIAPRVPTPKEMKRKVKDGIIEEAVFMLVVEVAGEEAGKKIKIRAIAEFPDLNYISRKFPGATYISYPTGIAVAAFSKIVPKIDDSGVFPPEALGSEIRKKILVELESGGIIIDEEFSKG